MIIVPIPRLKEKSACPSASSTAVGPIFCHWGRSRNSSPEAAPAGLQRIDRQNYQQCKKKRHHDLIPRFEAARDTPLVTMTIVTSIKIASQKICRSGLTFMLTKISVTCSVDLPANELLSER